MPRNPGSKKTGGRQKGTPNKVTASVKEALASAFETRGGVAGLVSWADKNPTEFYKLWGRLIPVEANIKHDGSMQFTIITGVDGGLSGG